MNDITPKEAIANLNHLYGMVSPDIQRSLDVAIKALERPTGDAISREALKEALTNTQTTLKYMGVFSVDDIKEFIDNAPTVPQVTVFAENADEQAVADMKAELQNVIEASECETCGYRLFADKLIDNLVDVMVKHGITSVEELVQKLKGGNKE